MTISIPSISSFWEHKPLIYDKQFFIDFNDIHRFPDFPYSTEGNNSN